MVIVLSSLVADKSRYGIGVLEEHRDPVDQIDAVKPEQKHNVSRIASTCCVKRDLYDTSGVMLTDQPIIELRRIEGPRRPSDHRCQMVHDLVRRKSPGQRVDTLNAINRCWRKTPDCSVDIGAAD